MFPLHLAVLFGFSDCCRKLLSSGMCWLVGDGEVAQGSWVQSGWYAPPGQLYSIVSSLSNEHVLSAGFDINTPDSLGRTCLHAAASGGCVPLLSLVSWVRVWVPTVCHHSRDCSVLTAQHLPGLVATLQGVHTYPGLPVRNVECLNLLLSSGADLRRRDKFGR